jgi:hypothetical protein
MTKVVDFNKFARKKQRKQSTDGKINVSGVDELACMVLSKSINESLRIFSDWVSQDDTEESTVEKLKHLNDLLKCKTFEASKVLYEGVLYDNIHVNTDLKRVSKWDLFKLLIGR